MQVKNMLKFLHIPKRLSEKLMTDTMSRLFYIMDVIVQKRENCPDAFFSVCQVACQVVEEQKVPSGCMKQRYNKKFNVAIGN